MGHCNSDTPQSPRKLGERRLLIAALSIAVGVGIVVLLVNFALGTWLWVSPEKRGPWTWLMRIGITTGLQRYTSYRLLGEYYESRELWQRAATLYRRATRTYPRDMQLRYGLVLSLFEAEGLSAAEAEAIEASQFLKRPHPLVVLELACDSHRMRAESLAVSEKLIELFPDIAGLWESLIEKQMRQGDTAAARATLERLLKANPESGEAWQVAAEFHRELGEIEEAKAAYRKAIALDQFFLRVRDYLEFLLELGQKQEAIDFVRSLPPGPSFGSHDPQHDPHRDLLKWLAEQEEGENP